MAYFSEIDFRIINKINANREQDELFYLSGINSFKKQDAQTKETPLISYFLRPLKKYKKNGKIFYYGLTKEELDYLFSESDLEQVDNNGMNALLAALKMNCNLINKLNSDQWNYLIENTKNYQPTKDKMPVLVAAIAWQKENKLIDSQMKKIAEKSNFKIVDHFYQNNKNKIELKYLRDDEKIYLSYKEEILLKNNLKPRSDQGTINKI